MPSNLVQIEIPRPRKGVKELAEEAMDKPDIKKLEAEIEALEQWRARRREEKQLER